MGDGQIEQTLFVAKEVNVYKIPPRAGVKGHISGDWKVADKIFTGRLRVVLIGDDCELRLEEPGSGELFAMCPVPLGQRAVAVEPVSDSSRYFVLRLVDAASGRHAFIGMGFGDRSDAFDFNVALSDHEKYVKRAEDVEAAAKAPDQASATEAGTLYQKQDLSLKEGETIKINVRRASGDKAASSSSTGAGFLSTLAPPPPSGTQQPQSHVRPLAPPAPMRPPTSSQPASTSSAGTAGAGGGALTQQPAADFLGLHGDSGEVAGGTAKLAENNPFGGKTATAATKEDSWATFE